MKRICVSSNCQTSGLVVALQELLPEAQVEALPLGIGGLESFIREFDMRVAGVDAWIALPGHEAVEWALKHRPEISARCIRVPAVAFTAFHPDLCYAWNEETRQLTRGSHYNSFIGIWAYRRGLTPRETATYFTRSVFEKIGYFAQWASSVTKLDWAFQHSDLTDSFERFFLRVRRTGCFMHSINHPRMPVMAALAELVVKRLGLEVTREAHLLDLPDALQGTIWPVYPEVAEHYGLGTGSYAWRFDMHRNRWIRGLEHYLEQAFRSYEAQGLNTKNMQVAFRDTAQHEAALLDQVWQSGGP